MKVLQVVPSLALRTGGPAVVAVEIARCVRARGVESTVFATDMAYPAQAVHRGRLTSNGLPHGWEAVDLRLFPARAPYRLVYSPELGKALRKEVAGYDVVHIHSLFLYPQFAAAREANRYGVPCVFSLHGALDPWLRRRGRLQKALADALWQRRALKRAAALHLTTADESQLVADVAPRVPRRIVPMGIRWGEYQQLPSGEDFRAERLGGHRGPVVLNVGRISVKKGLDLLIKAFARVVHEEALLAIAGPDDEGLQSKLEALAAREGVRDRVVFTGLVQGDDKLAAFAAADVWALSSHTENFGVAVMEAFAAGLPTVISPAVNLAPEVKQAGAGIVCRLDEAALAETIDSLLGDAARREELGARARQFARRFDWDALAPDLVELYEAVAKRRV
jgi:glycosyltransferase involved in cell wall biosynthesis